jgi:uncharacterized protein
MNHSVSDAWRRFLPITRHRQGTAGDGDYYVTCHGLGSTAKVVGAEVSYSIGILSDTHGLLRPEVTASLQGSDRIVHAGDIGAPEIIERLSLIAPVTAVRGNNDQGEWAERFPECQHAEFAGMQFQILHDVSLLDMSSVPATVRVVISGHSHKASSVWRSGVLYLNPGSAGPRRFHLPVTVARVGLNSLDITVDILELDVATPPPRGRRKKIGSRGDGHRDCETGT